MYDIRTPAQQRQARIDGLAGLFSENHGKLCDVADDGDWHRDECDPHWNGHGLAWWLPRILEWVGVRSTSGRSGAAGTVAAPIDLGALDFVIGRYWTADEPPTDQTIGEEENYRAGFIPTVLGLEGSIRAALGRNPRPRCPVEGSARRVYPQSELVYEAMAWVAEHVALVVDNEQRFLEDTLRDEAFRLISRCSSMLYGRHFEATTNPCMYCHDESSVVADEDRAVCINPFCRDDAGRRRCWRLVDVDDLDQLGYPSYLGYAPRGKRSALPHLEWVEVDEPDIRGRGRVTDEQVLEWVAGTGYTPYQAAAGY